MGIYGSNDPTNSVKAPKEIVVLRIRFQAHHVTILKHAIVVYSDTQNTYIHKNESKHSEMHPVRQMVIVWRVRVS